MSEDPRYCITYVSLPVCSDPKAQDPFPGRALQRYLNESGESPAEGYEDDEGTGASLL